MLVTKHGFDYSVAPYGKICFIPAGVPVVPVSYQDENNPKYWVEPWMGINKIARSWQHDFGFMVNSSQVTESPFALGQRVRILPTKYYPPTKRGSRYGIILAATQCPGMFLSNRFLPNGCCATNAEGEWAFMVAASPKAGTTWFSPDGLQPVKQTQKKI